VLLVLSNPDFFPFIRGGISIVPDFLYFSFLGRVEALDSSLLFFSSLTSSLLIIWSSCSYPSNNYFSFSIKLFLMLSRDSFISGVS
jgi:hypothetical protein